MDSGLRKISILSKLSRSKSRRVSAANLQKQLADEGYSVSLRTIQRDLVELSTQFPLCSDDTKPIGWYIAKEADLTISNLDLTTAVTWILAGQHLTHLLPLQMRESLKPYTNTAKQFLSAEKANPAIHWDKKIKVHGKGLPLYPADISEEIIDAIYSSLLMESCICLTYISLKTGKEKTFVFHPYGIVVRAERSYLIGKYDKYEDIRQLSFSRIIKADRLERKALIDSCFKLDEYIEKGEMSLLRSSSKLEMKLWITPFLAKILSETPIDENQHIEPRADDFLLTASVDDSDELRYWLLSMCNHVTVIEPISLRKEIINTLKNSLSYY